MTFKQLQDEVIALRFDESRRSSVKSWLNLGYANIWDKANWTFKTTSTALTITSGDNSPAMPADFATALDLYDQYGCPLEYVDRRDFESYSLPLTSGTPGFYTVIDRQIYLGSIPGAATYSLSYRRRLSHVDSVSGIIGGVMVDDADQPLWPAEHDYTLVFEACLVGETITGDPTSARLLQQRDEKLAGMIADLTTNADEQLVQWGGTLAGGY